MREWASSMDGGGSMRRASIRQVAAEAGVSMSTVSNVLNNPHVVSVHTRRRVEEAMTAMGYVPNSAARQLRGAPAMTAGCLVLDTANPFFAAVARGIEDRLAEESCMLVVCSTDVRPDREERYLHMLEQLGVRGILLVPVSSELAAAVAVGRRGTPVVLIDHPRGDLPTCAAAVDNVRGGELAAEHLLGLGHRRMALLTSQSAVRSLTDRAHGFHRGIVAAGLEPDSTLVSVPLLPPVDVETAERAIVHVLAASPRPTAVVCFNDMTAVGAMRGLRAAGVAVPEQMSVIGYDDLVFAAQLAPALTTIRQPTYELGRAAAELLLAEGMPGHRHQEVLFTPELVVRRSTAAAPAPRTR